MRTGGPGGAARGDRMQNKPRSPESSGLKRQRSLALKKLLKQLVMLHGGEGIKTAASQTPLNFATNITISGLPGASKSFSTNLPSTAVKFPSQIFPGEPDLSPRSDGEMLLPSPTPVSPFAQGREQPARDTCPTCTGSTRSARAHTGQINPQHQRVVNHFCYLLLLLRHKSNATSGWPGVDG